MFLLQLLNERLMGAEGTKMDEDFLKMEKVKEWDFSLCPGSKWYIHEAIWLTSCLPTCLPVPQTVVVIYSLLVELLSKTTEFLQPNPGTEKNKPYWTQHRCFHETQCESQETQTCCVFCVGWQRTEQNWACSTPCPGFVGGAGRWVTHRQSGCWETACCTTAKSSVLPLNLVRQLFPWQQSHMEH